MQHHKSVQCHYVVFTFFFPCGISRFYLIQLFAFCSLFRVEFQFSTKAKYFIISRRPSIKHSSKRSNFCFSFADSIYTGVSDPVGILIVHPRPIRIEIINTFDLFCFSFDGKCFTGKSSLINSSLSIFSIGESVALLAASTILRSTRFDFNIQTD